MIRYNNELCRLRVATLSNVIEFRQIQVCCSRNAFSLIGAEYVFIEALRLKHVFVLRHKCQSPQQSGLAQAPHVSPAIICENGTLWRAYGNRFRIDVDGNVNRGSFAVLIVFYNGADRVRDFVDLSCEAPMQ